MSGCATPQALAEIDRTIVDLNETLHTGIDDNFRFLESMTDNATDVPFTTADQPVMNVASGPLDTAPPEKFELYYPFSPTKAMLLIESGDAAPDDRSVSETFVRLHNLRKAAHSYRQVFSNTPQFSNRSSRNFRPT